MDVVAINNIKNILATALDNYYAVLQSVGQISYCETYGIIAISFIYDALEDGIIFSNGDIEKILTLIRCVLNNCTLSIATNYTPKVQVFSYIIE